MKVYIVYEIFKDNNDYQEWFNYESSIDSVYIDKNKALERATEIFNTAKNFEEFEDYWGHISGPESPEDLIKEFEVK